MNDLKGLKYLLYISYEIRNNNYKKNISKRVDKTNWQMENRTM
jgi:hypothetical protein